MKLPYKVTFNDTPVIRIPGFLCHYRDFVFIFVQKNKDWGYLFLAFFVFFFLIPSEYDKITEKRGVKK